MNRLFSLLLVLALFSYAVYEAEAQYYSAGYYPYYYSYYPYYSYYYGSYPYYYYGKRSVDMNQSPGAQNFQQPPMQQ